MDPEFLYFEDKANGGYYTVEKSFYATNKEAIDSYQSSQGRNFVQLDAPPPGVTLQQLDAPGLTAGFKMPTEGRGAIDPNAPSQFITAGTFDPTYGLTPVEGGFAAPAGTPAPTTTTGTSILPAGVNSLTPNPVDSQTAQQIANTQTQQDTDLNEILANSGLDADQQEMIRQLYGVISTQDQALAAKFKLAFEQAAAMGDPYWKSQIRLVADELQRGFVSLEQDLQFKETQLRNRMTDLQSDLEATKDFLSLEQSSQLTDLERQYKQTLANTQNDLAARGFTQSTERMNKEQLLSDTTGSMRESITRRIGEQVRRAETGATTGVRDINSEIVRLQELAEQGKLDLFRAAEQKLGSSNLPTLPGAPAALGQIYGEIPSSQLQDVVSASTSLIF